MAELETQHEDLRMEEHGWQSQRRKIWRNGGKNAIGNAE